MPLRRPVYEPVTLKPTFSEEMALNFFSFSFFFLKVSCQLPSQVLSPSLWRLGDRRGRAFLGPGPRRRKPEAGTLGSSRPSAPPVCPVLGVRHRVCHVEQLDLKAASALGVPKSVHDASPRPAQRAVRVILFIYFCFPVSYLWVYFGHQ